MYIMHTFWVLNRNVHNVLQNELFDGIPIGDYILNIECMTSLNGTVSHISLHNIAIKIQNIT